jgi:hypothetical protein
VFGGNAGGFIGTTAYDGRAVYGSTALGDFPGPPCDPSNPRDTPLQEPTAHAFSSSTGTVRWQAEKDPSFAPTTVAGGMTFNAPALAPVIVIRHAETGIHVIQVPIPVPCWSGIATVGDALVFGTGSSYVGSPDGVVVMTPAGGTPAVPAA